MRDKILWVCHVTTNFRMVRDMRDTHYIYSVSRNAMLSR